MRCARSAALIAVALLAVPAARADLCVTFADSVDNFEGQVTASKGGFNSIAMIETLFNRAAYGSAALRGDHLFMGWTKDTNTAAVHYQCDIDLVTLRGPCQIQVYVAQPFSSSLLSDFATLEVGACALPAGRNGLPRGEGAP